MRVKLVRLFRGVRIETSGYLPWYPRSIVQCNPPGMSHECHVLHDAIAIERILYFRSYLQYLFFNLAM